MYRVYILPWISIILAKDNNPGEGVDLEHLLQHRRLVSVDFSYQQTSSLDSFKIIQIPNKHASPYDSFNHPFCHCFNAFSSIPLKCYITHLKVG